jgi:hypothetical protein
MEGRMTDPYEHHLTLTPKELQTLTAAMAGNFPESLNEYRMPLLRKLAKAQHTDTQGVVEALRRASVRSDHYGKPTTTHGWVQVSFRPEDWATLDALREQ